MTDALKAGNSVLRVIKDDITNLDIDSFVYYARSDLKLGSGFGGAITIRGGPSIQAELDKFEPLESCGAVVSEAGELKAKKIIHANGPKFQEEDLEDKLKTTVINALKTAEKAKVARVAFPPMGTGFYGVPLAVSAKITMGTIKEYLEKGSKLTEVVLCAMDNHEFKPYAEQLGKLG
jgi:O-acetyl-ADP-ribose deacetylase (regulator of RNase III)